MIITDSIPGTEAVRLAKNIRQLSIAPLLGEAIKRIAESKSVSSLLIEHIIKQKKIVI